MRRSTLLALARARARRSLRGGFLLALLACSLLSRSASANLRAPRTDPRDGSSALYPVQGVQVLHEDLRFRCRGGACEIHATYSVFSEQEQAVELTFLLPSRGPVQAKIAGQPLAVVVVSAEPLDPRELASLSSESQRTTPSLHKATFRGTLRAGRDSIEVRYSQAGDAREHGHGYFSEGSFVYQVRYEIWPLRQWTLAPDFTLTLRVQYEREQEPTWFQRWRGRLNTLVCRGEQGARIGPADSRSARTIAWVESLPAAALPERLVCEMGSERFVAP